MAKKDEPSYTDLVYEVVKSAARPLTFQEILDEVNGRRPVTTRDPKATIRSALSQSRQLLSTGDGRYGYLPHLVTGSLLRVPLTDKKPANHPLIYPTEARFALWPGFFESQKRRVTRPVQLSLPGGKKVTLSLEFLGRGKWGTPMPEGLRRFLIENHVSEGTSLLIRVVDGEIGRCEAWLESQVRRDKAAVDQRNRELADAAYQVLRKRLPHETSIWDLAFAMLARGLYRSDMAPDTLDTVLRADPRITYTGLEMWLPTEAVTTEMRALIRRREKMDAQMFEWDREAPAEVEVAPSATAVQRSLERTLADVRAALSEREFGSIEEANVFLKEMLAGGGGVPPRKAATPLDEAQDLMYDAWEAATSRERVRLAKQALQISPDCADAYVLLAEETARGPKEAAEFYTKGVAAGERALGKEVFEEDVGHFWGMVETRPYMRARAGLAQALWAMGKTGEAIGHLWEMLKLNPGDNQGIRYLLLNRLLETGDDAQVKKLLGLFPDDIAAVWLYGRALHAFRTEGDSKRSRKLRSEAKRENPYVPDYLLGRKRLPKRLPETVGFGDESEAVACAAQQAMAWIKAPGAFDWLGQREG